MLIVCFWFCGENQFQKVILTSIDFCLFVRVNCETNLHKCGKIVSIDRCMYWCVQAFRCAFILIYFWEIFWDNRTEIEHTQRKGNYAMLDLFYCSCPTCLYSSECCFVFLSAFFLFCFRNTRYQYLAYCDPFVLCFTYINFCSANKSFRVYFCSLLSYFCSFYSLFSILRERLIVLSFSISLSPCVC